MNKGVQPSRNMSLCLNTNTQNRFLESRNTVHSKLIVERASDEDSSKSLMMDLDESRVEPK